MSIFKRGKVYWINFWWNDQHVQRTTKQGNPRVARQIEAALRTSLAKEEVGIFERKRRDRLREFIPKFLQHMAVHCASKPRTLRFWKDSTKRLLSFGPLADAHLDQINEALVARYVEFATQQKVPAGEGRKRSISAATVNRSLAALRRSLRLAQEWNEMDRVPRIRMLPGERNREFILTGANRENYLAIAPEPLRTIASFLLETGFRLGEALSLTWNDVHLNPVGEATRGYIAIPRGKSKYAKRNVSLTEEARQILTAPKPRPNSNLVFAREDGSAVSRFTLSDQHERVKKTLKLPKDFVLHSLRHTMLTNLAASGADSFVIQRVAGHSSIVISQRYVHPTPESLEKAFARLERFSKGPARETELTPTTKATTMRMSRPAM